jgi:hypothetical protein
MAKLNNTTNLYTPNTIIVDAAGGPFTTIASAITAAVGLGQPTIIYVREGTYTENLTLIAGINIRGANNRATTINGSHIIPAAGTLGISNIILAASAGGTHVFNEAGAGTCAISLNDCVFNINSGMIFNLPLSTGFLKLVDCEDSSTANSIITNITGHSGISFSGCTLGVGAVAALFAGPTWIISSLINVAITASAAAALIIKESNITGTITLGGTSTLAIDTSHLTSGASAAISIGGTSSAILSNVVINSSAAQVVTGAGSCTYGEVTFDGAASTHNATTEVYTTRILGGTLQLGTTNAGVMYSTAGVLGSTAALTNGQMLIGNSGNPPSVGTISAAAGSGITVTAGAGTLALSSTAPFAWTQINADGALVINQGSVNIKAGLLTMSLPATSPINSVITLAGVGAGGWKITQAANKQILVGNTNTTLGDGGTLSSTDKGDCVSMVCTTADLVWRVFGTVGNLTVV